MELKAVDKMRLRPIINFFYVLEFHAAAASTKGKLRKSLMHLVIEFHLAGTNAPDTAYSPNP